MSVESYMESKHPLVRSLAEEFETASFSAVPRVRGVYFFLLNSEIVYVGKADNDNGMFGRIVKQHLQASYLEPRVERFFGYQKDNPIRNSKGVPVVDKSVLRMAIGDKYKLLPGQPTVDWILNNLTVKMLEVKTKSLIKELEQDFIGCFSPIFNNYFGEE